jgi:hypothetical protein
MRSTPIQMGSWNRTGRDFPAGRRAPVPEKPLKRSALTAIPATPSTEHTISDSALWALLVVQAFLMRPAMLGEELTPVAITLVPGLSAAILYLGWKSSRPSPRHAATLVVSNLFWVYQLLVCVGRNFHALDAFKGLVTQITIVNSFCLVLSIPRLQRQFFTWFTYCLSILGISSLITWILLFVFPIESLTVYTYSAHAGATVGHYEYQFLFPISVLYQEMDMAAWHDATVLYRFSGGFREVGILQAFAAFGIIYSYIYKLPRWIYVGLLASLLLSFSTLGVAGLMVGFGFLAVARSKFGIAEKVFIGVTCAALAVAAFLYTPYIGYFDKSQTHGGSFSDRTDMMENGVRYGLTTLFGTQNASVLRQRHVAISFVAQASMIGLVGFCLGTAVYLTPLFGRSTDRGAYFALIQPLFITAMVAQPMMDAPLTLIMCFVAAPRANEEREPPSGRRARGRQPRSRVTASVPSYAGWRERPIAWTGSKLSSGSHE